MRVYNAALRESSADWETRKQAHLSKSISGQNNRPGGQAGGRLSPLEGVSRELDRQQREVARISGGDGEQPGRQQASLKPTGKRFMKLVLGFPLLGLQIEPFSLISNSENYQPQVPESSELRGGLKKARTACGPVRLSLRCKRPLGTPSLRNCGGHRFGRSLLACFPADTPAFTWCNHQEVNAFLGQVGEGQLGMTLKLDGCQHRERGHGHSGGQA